MEYTAHTALHLLPPSLSFTSFEMPAHSIKEITEYELPITWRQQPFSKDSQEIGSVLLTQKDYLLLKLPSVLIDGEFNFVLNTLHPLISAVKIIGVAGYKIHDWRLANTHPAEQVTRLCNNVFAYDDGHCLQLITHVFCL